MNISRIALLLILQYMLVVNSGVQASTQLATLVIPEALDILSVDKKTYTGKLFSRGDKTLKLEPGQHEILVEYDIIWDISADDHENIQSKPFQITFSAEPGKQYYIKLPSFKYVEEAQKYAKKPVFELIDRTTNRVVATKVTHHDVYRSIFSNRFSEPVAATKPVHDPVPAASVIAVPATNKAASQSVDTNNTNSTPVKMLEYWWNQANEQQRKHFLESIQ